MDKDKKSSKLINFIQKFVKPKGYITKDRKANNYYTGDIKAKHKPYWMYRNEQFKKNGLQFNKEL